MSYQDFDWTLHRPSPSTKIWIRTDKRYQIVMTDILTKKEKKKGKYAITFFKNRIFPSKARPEWGIVVTHYVNTHSTATRRVNAFMEKYGLIKRKKKTDLGLDEIMRG